MLQSRRRAEGEKTVASCGLRVEKRRDKEGKDGCRSQTKSSEAKECCGLGVARLGLSFGFDGLFGSYVSRSRFSDLS